MILQITAAFIGTIAFALLFSVPRKDYIPAGVIGALGWLVYCVLTQTCMSDVPASFLATLVVVFLARWFAVMFQTPSTIFLITGIFPLRVRHRARHHGRAPSARHILQIRRHLETHQKIK